MQAAPEYQAHTDWREEAAFHPEQYIGADERVRYIAEAKKILQQDQEAV